MQCDNVGIVIVHYHRENDLQRLLHDLVGTGVVPQGHIVVADNGSDRVLTDVIEASLPAIRWLRLNNPGYGAAMNAGVAALPDHLTTVMLLTHEVELSENCIPRLLARLESSPDIGLVGPVLMQSGKDTVWSVGGTTSRFRRVPSNLCRGVEPAVIDPSSRVVDWLDGAVVMMRREDFVRVGGLSEEYFLYFEDVDLGWKIRTQLGKRVECDRSIRAAQAPGGSLDNYLATRNRLWLLRKQGYRMAWLILVLESMLRVVVGPIAKPKNSRRRVTQRITGLVDGLRRPAGRNRGHRRFA